MRFFAFLWWLACALVLATNGLNSLAAGHHFRTAIWLVGALMAFDNLRDVSKDR
jgi:hypothetical protein